MTEAPDFMLEIPKHPSSAGLFTGATSALGGRARGRLFRKI
jgi:hypothetical protein